MPITGISRGAQLLAEWRGERAQKEACADFEIDRFTYNRLERGDRRPGAYLSVRIEKLTGGRVPATSWYEKAAKKRSRGVGR